MLNCGERKHARTFFEWDRTFKIFFLYKNDFYKGYLDNISDAGVGVIIEGKLNAEPGTEISKFYLHKLEMDYLIENLQIVYCIDNTAINNNISNSNSTRIGIKADNPLYMTKLTDIWNNILEKKTSQENPQKFKTRQIPYNSKNQYSKESIQKRIDWIEYTCNEKLHYIPQTVLDPKDLAGNIEFYIGAVQIPLGIGGPLLVNGKYTKNYVPIPIATTEGALLSSLTRGAFACNLSGGVNVHVQQQVMLRAPVFYCRTMQGVLNLEKWIKNNIQYIKRKTENVSSIAKLQEISTHIFGSNMHVQFVYTTGDAAGQNMTTTCTFVACEWIVKCIKEDDSINYIHYAIDGNMSGDKKVSFQNMLKGRGTSVVAELFIEERTLKRILHVSKADILRSYNTAVVGCAKIGTLGVDINVSNVLAGIYTATGQDIACVYESSAAIVNIADAGDGVIYTLHLPSLIIGTLGGGTKLPTQKECLKIMNCYGPNKLYRFAEIIGASCLALGLSTLAAVYTNEYVTAHDKLGRNRPSGYVSKSDINVKFFNSLLLDKNFRVIDFQKNTIDNSSGILSNFADKNIPKMCGIFRYNLKLANGGKEEPENISVILKLKPTDSEIISVGQQLMFLTNDDFLPTLFKDHEEVFGYNNCHIREVNFYKHANDTLLKYTPHVYGFQMDESKDLYALLLEDLSGLSHYDTINNPVRWWDEKSINTALAGLAEIHSVFFEKYDAIHNDILIHTPDYKALMDAVELLDLLTRNNSERKPNLIDEECLSVYQRFLSGFSGNIKKIFTYPRTLTHNDFQPRNICLKPAGDEYELLVYDWELMAYQNPQIDIIEFLINVLPGNMNMDEFIHYCDYYYQNLKEKTGQNLPRNDFYDILHTNAVYLGLTRYNMYLLSHIILDYQFIDRVYINLSKIIKAGALK